MTNNKSNKLPKQEDKGKKSCKIKLPKKLFDFVSVIFSKETQQTKIDML